MQRGVQHRIVLAGVEDSLQPALKQALRARGADVAAVCADLPSTQAEALSHPADGHLIIAQLGPQVDLDRLAALTSVLPGQPVMVLLPAGADLARVVAVQRAGAAQVVPLPWQTDDFLRALDCIAGQFAAPVREARVLAVCGVSGGAGATTLALNLAYELGHPGQRAGGCLLVELARQMGTLAAYLDIEPIISTHELLTDASRLTAHGIREALTTIVPGLDVLVGPYLDITPANFSPRHVYQLVELCRRQAATVVLDVPCAFDDLQFETLALADQVVLVGVQSVSSIRTLKMVRDTLEREEGIRGQRLVINRYEPALPGFSAARLSELLQVPQVLTVANDYASVMAAVNHGKPLRLVTPHSRALADIRSIADTLVEGGPSLAPAEGDRLARALGRGPAEPPPPRAMRVLHIEDDVLQQEVIALHLTGIKGLRCTVVPVASESEAVAQFRRQPFDVVLLDYHLAQGNGLGCLRQLRALAPIVPIVVISGVADPQVAAELLDAGADDFLSKENLTGEALARSLAVAVARADACKQRLVIEHSTEPAQVDAFFDQMRKTAGARDEKELLHSLHELQQSGWPSRFSAGQIQRLVDLVCGELDKTPSAGGELPRRALLALFLRLFGGEAGGRE
jgi:Flp pilus assembly CpaE family ATPase/CheY-like chemotaxis protein